MAREGLTRTALVDFSAGMYRNASLDRLPVGASWNLENALLDLQGGHASRGGSVYRSTAAFGSSLRWIWDGWLTSGHVTLIASGSAFGRLEANGSVTNLGEGGLAAPVRPAVLGGKMFFPGGKTYDGTTWGALVEGAGTADFVTVAANRLLVAHGTRVRFSNVGDPTKWGETDYHEIPTGVQILGLEGSRESCVVFTTQGIWVISGLTNELTDTAGNVQQRLDHYSGEIALWGDAGVAAWKGSLVVPGTDAVWLISRGVTSEQIASFSRISDPIVDLYRGYVQDGFSPGRAAVFGNHYFLPVIGAGTIYDMLVCRLDLPEPKGRPAGAWTRFSGAGAKVSALTSRLQSGAAREPELLGAGYVVPRVLTLEYLNDAVPADADGSFPAWRWQTGAIPTGSAVRNLLARIRLQYQLQPTLVESVPALPVSVVDNFNRSESPLNAGGNWIILPGAESRGVLSGGGEWAASPGSTSGAYWHSSQSSPAVSIPFTSIAGLTSGWLRLWACAAGGETKSGYAVKVAYAGEVGRYRLTLESWAAGTPTELWSGVVSLVAGDGVGVSVRGGIVRVWVSYAAEVWTLLESVADATYSTGFAGLEANTGAVTVNSFSLAAMPAGALVESKPTIVAAVANDSPTVGSAVWGGFSWGEAAWASPGEAGFDTLEGEAPVDLSAVKPFRWPVRRKRRAVSFRFTVSEPAARVAVKSLELFVRQVGRL